MFLMWSLFFIIVIVISFFIICFFSFYTAFYSKKRKPLKDDEYLFPKEEVYKPYKKQLLEWMKKYRTLPHEDLEITSFDGLKLRAKYFEKEKGAPIEVLFNGYRGSAERDLSGGIERAFALNRNVVLVDQRATGRSEGCVSTFGIKERFDAVRWAEFLSEKFGENSIILLGGVSLGATTVLNASKFRLPKNVKCILADSPYTSPKDIIKKVIKDMGLPADLFYPFIKISARLFGGFNLDEASPIDSVKETKLPIFLVHGDADEYVPYYMSEEIFQNIKTDKKALVKIKGAGHGLGYPVNKELYINSVKDFEKYWK